MLNWFHKRLKPLGRGLLATAVSLWLVTAVAPCAMAQTQPATAASVPCHMDMGMAQTGMKDCGPAMAMKCKLPDVNSPLASAPGNPSVTPTVLTVLPVALILSGTGPRLRPDFVTPDIPAPPLHIRHLTLIL